MKTVLILIVSLLGCLNHECRAESVGFYKAYLTLLACQTEESLPNPVECHCNGTGKSGDGLGPCVCGENCQCARKSTPVNVRPIDGITDILKDAEPVQTEANPEIKLLYFSTSNCPPCVSVETEFQAMRKTGWKIGNQTDDHIVLKSDYWRYGVTSWPCFILLADGVEVKRHYGYMNRWQIAKFRSVPDRRSVASQSPVRETMIAQDIEIPGLRTPFEKTVCLFQEMLGTTYKPNSFVTVTSPKRVEISIEERDGKIYILFHGESKPKISAVGVFESDVTHMIAEGNKITVYWNGVIGLLKNHLTVEFE